MKEYVRPTIEVIDLRTEERLAHCNKKQQFKGPGKMRSGPGKGGKHPKCHIQKSPGNS